MSKSVSIFHCFICCLTLLARAAGARYVLSSLIILMYSGIIPGVMTSYAFGRAEPNAAQSELVPWYHPKFSPKFSDLVAIFGIVFGGSTLVNALYQARRAQIWKRKEFVAQQMEVFTKDPAVQRVLSMLDYNMRYMDLSDSIDHKDLKNVKVDHFLVAAALVPHSLGKMAFTRIEATIRDNFDVFFERLDKFHVMIKAGVIEIDDIRPYLIYWLETISGKRIFLSEDLLRVIRLYIDEYGFIGIKELCMNMNCSIELRNDDRCNLEKEVFNGDWIIGALQSQIALVFSLAAAQLMRRKDYDNAAHFEKRAKKYELAFRTAVLMRDLPPDIIFLDYLASCERRDRETWKSEDVEVFQKAAKLLVVEELVVMAKKFNIDPHSEIEIMNCNRHC